MPSSDPAEIGIRDFIAYVWEAKWLVIAITALFTLVAAAAGLLIEKKYRAEILVSPVTEQPSAVGGTLGALASEYSGLASLAGVSVSGRGGNVKEETLAVLKSELITEAYVQANNLLPVLYWKSWDEHANRWKTTDPKRIPTLWMANQAFKKIRDVKEDRISGIVTLRITWRDPVTAARWANELVRTTNDYLRDKAIRESERNITYLNEEAAKTDAVEAKAAIYSILKGEVNKQMIAKGREEYALKVLDPARVPERPSTPSALFLGILGFGMGLVVSVLLVLFRRSLQRTRPAA